MGIDRGTSHAHRHLGYMALNIYLPTVVILSLPKLGRRRAVSRAARQGLPRCSTKYRGFYYYLRPALTPPRFSVSNSQQPGSGFREPDMSETV